MLLSIALPALSHACPFAACSNTDLCIVNIRGDCAYACSCPSVFLLVLRERRFAGVFFSCFSFGGGSVASKPFNASSNESGARLSFLSFVFFCSDMASPSRRLQKVIVICMRSNKEPENGVTLLYAYNPIVIIYSCRVPGFFLVNALKTKAWVIRVLFKNVIGTNSLFLHILRYFSK